jgi:hypothetical protein
LCCVFVLRHVPPSHRRGLPRRFVLPSFFSLIFLPDLAILYSILIFLQAAVLRAFARPIRRATVAAASHAQLLNHPGAGAAITRDPDPATCGGVTASGGEASDLLSGRTERGDAAGSPSFVLLVGLCENKLQTDKYLKSLGVQRSRWDTITLITLITLICFALSPSRLSSPLCCE